MRKDSVVGFSSMDYHDPPPAALIDLEELGNWSFYRAVIAEFISTFLFLYITVLILIGCKSQSTEDECGGVGILGIGWAFGGMIFCPCLLHRWHFRGAHQPGCDIRVIPGSKGVISPGYILHGSSMLRSHLWLWTSEGIPKVILCDIWQRRQQFGSGYSTGTGFAAKMVGTFVLVCTVFSATDPKRNDRDSHVPVLAPLPIGFAVFMVHLATIPITCTGNNPARSFRAAIIFGKDKAWDDQ